jgi:hypoxanthine phosphoribosyltransferase
MQKVFISAESLLRDAMQLAVQIVRSGFRPTFLVAVWRGGAPIGITVQEVLEYHGVHADHIAIRTSSYTGIDQQSKTVRVHALDYLVSRLSAEDQLLLVDDVFDSGLSIEAIMNELANRCRRNLPGADPDRHRVLQAGAQSQRPEAGLLRARDQRLAGVPT